MDDDRGANGVVGCVLPRGLTSGFGTEFEREHIMDNADATPTPEPPSSKELRLAMKAFRKRLKLTRLDDESRMGYGPTSSGQNSGVVAIVPPNQFSKAVWRELVKQGKVRHDGGGLYSLVKQSPD
jgi:hypothetical protein